MGRKHGENEAGGAPDAAHPRRGGMTRFRTFLVVCALLAAAFGGGSLLVYLRLRDERAAWQKERAGLTAQVAEQARQIAAAKPRELLWRLDEGFSTILIHLAEKNYGLARDATAAVTAMLAQAPTDLDEEVRAGFAQIGPLLKDVERAAEALRPDARSGAMRAKEILLRLIERPRTAP